jgi:hypothetical protein
MFPNFDHDFLDFRFSSTDERDCDIVIQNYRNVLVSECTGIP